MPQLPPQLYTASSSLKMPLATPCREGEEEQRPVSQETCRQTWSRAITLGGVSRWEGGLLFKAFWVLATHGLDCGDDHCHCRGYIASISCITFSTPLSGASAWRQSIGSVLRRFASQPRLADSTAQRYSGLLIGINPRLAALIRRFDFCTKADRFAHNKNRVAGNQPECGGY